MIHTRTTRLFRDEINLEGVVMIHWAVVRYSGQQKTLLPTLFVTKEQAVEFAAKLSRAKVYRLVPITAAEEPDVDGDDDVDALYTWQNRGVWHWDRPIVTTDHKVYVQCPMCENHGPHPYQQQGGVISVRCDTCDHEFTWTLMLGRTF